jgi:hypothetical protein
MKYRKGLKYQLAEDEIFYTGMKIGIIIKTQFAHMDQHGKLTVLSGWGWDGPSGPTKAIASMLEKIPFAGEWLVQKFLKGFLRGSCGHDVLYYFLRNGWLQPHWRKDIDLYLKQCCLEDNMLEARAAWVYRGVDSFAGFAADPKNRQKIYKAP